MIGSGRLLSKGLPPLAPLVRCPLASAIVTPGAVLRRRISLSPSRDSSLVAASLRSADVVPRAAVSTTQLMMKFLAFNRSTGRNYPHKAAPERER